MGNLYPNCKSYHDNSDKWFHNYEPAQMKFHMILYFPELLIQFPDQHEILRLGKVVNNFLLFKAVINTLLFKAANSAF